MTSTKRLVATAGIPAVIVAVLATSVYTSFQRVRVRAVTEARQATEPAMTFALPPAERFDDQPVAIMLVVEGTDRPVPLDVRVGTAAVGQIVAPAGRHRRFDLALASLSTSAGQLTIAGSEPGWTLHYLELANVHGYTAEPAEVLIVPRERVEFERPAPPWAWPIVFAALLALRPTMTWSSRLVTALHRTAGSLAVLVLAGTLLAPLVTPYRLLLSVSAVALLAAVLYAEWLSRPVRAFARRASAGRAPLAVAPLPGWSERLLVSGLMAGVVAAVLHVQVLNLNAVPDLGDPLFSMWRIGWILHQLGQDPARLFDANIFYPASYTLTYSDAIILPALAAAPVWWLAGPVVTYNLLLLFAFVLSGIAMYLLARGLGFGPVASWIAGVLFALLAFRLDHYSHLELQMTHWMPLVLLGVHRVVAGGGRGWIFFVALALGAQWYSSMYYGLFLTVYAAAFAGIVAWTARAGRQLWRAAVAVVLGVLLALPLILVYARTSGGERPIDAVRTFSAVPSDYLRASARSRLYGNRTATPRPERALFPGLVSPVLAAAGARPPWAPLNLTLLGTGLLAFDGSLGLNGVVYPRAFEHVPAVRAVRVPARFAVFVGLTLALLSAAGVERWQRSRLGRKVPTWLTALSLTAVVMADPWPSIPLVRVWPASPGIYAALPADRDVVLFEYPMSPEPHHFARNLPFMYFSLQHFRPMVNGYSGILPEHYQDLARSLDGFPTSETLAHLRSIGVTHVTVICALDGEVDERLISLAEPRACMRTLEALDAAPEVRAVARESWQGAPAVLYEFRPDAGVPSRSAR